MRAREGNLVKRKIITVFSCITDALHITYSIRRHCNETHNMTSGFFFRLYTKTRSTPVVKTRIIKATTIVEITAMPIKEYEKYE